MSEIFFDHHQRADSDISGEPRVVDSSNRSQGKCHKEEAG